MGHISKLPSKLSRLDDAKFNEKVNNFIFLSIIISTFLIYIVTRIISNYNRCTFIDYSIYKLWIPNIKHYNAEFYSNYLPNEVCAYLTANTSMFILMILYSIWRVFIESHRTQISVYKIFLNTGPILLLIGIVASFFPYHAVGLAKIGLGYDHTIGQNLFRSCLIIVFIFLVLGGFIAALFEKMRRRKLLLQKYAYEERISSSEARHD